MSRVTVALASGSGIGFLSALDIAENRFDDFLGVKHTSNRLLYIINTRFPVRNRKNNLQELIVQKKLSSILDKALVSSGHIFDWIISIANNLREVSNIGIASVECVHIISLCEKIWVSREIAPAEIERKRQLIWQILTDDEANEELPALQTSANQQNTLKSAELSLMTLEKRKLYLDQYYSNRTSWTNKRPARPKPLDLLAWLDEAFPDRRELGLVVSDLLHLDRSAYDRIANWVSRPPEGIDGDIRDMLGIPTKIIHYDSALDPAHVPTKAQIYEAFRGGDPVRGMEMQKCYQRHKNRGLVP